MTSLIIEAMARRVSGKASIDSCAFCKIIQGETPAYKVYEDDMCLAFLDILPIRTGHTLLIPKDHHARLTDLPPSMSSHLGAILPKLCRAICKAAEQPDFNVVMNNGYAQVVPHVHWHIVPAPTFGAQSNVQPNRPNGMYGFSTEIQNRHQLDDEVAECLVNSIRQALQAEPTATNGKLAKL